MSDATSAIQVLHLVGRPPDFQTARAIDGLSTASDPAPVRIGPGGRWRHPLTAAWALRSAAADAQVVHCWDDRALTAAVVAGVPRVVFSPQNWPTRQTIGWVRAAISYRNLHVACPTATMHRYYGERGVPLDRLHLVRPGVDFSRVRRRRDPDLRSRLGIADDDFVLLVPGESIGPADHALAVWAGTILACLDPRYRVLLVGRGPRAAAAMALGPKMGQHRLVIDAGAKLGPRTAFEALTAAADAALVSANGGGVAPAAPHRPAAPTLPVAYCMAAALPIVSVVTPTLAELLEDRHTSVMVTEPKARLLAAKVLALRDDPALARQIADTAAAEAYEHWSLSTFRLSWQEVYRRVLA